MPVLEYENLLAVLIALFAAVAACVGGYPVAQRKAGQKNRKEGAVS